MGVPVNKNKRWIAGLHESLGQLPKDLQAAVMKPAGEGCASDLLALCEGELGRPVETVEELVHSWNGIRRRNQLKGEWEIEEETIRGVFHQCACPLVSSKMIELHPVQCYCSLGMMQTIFSRVAKRRVEVSLERSIGRGDDVCEFVVAWP